MPFLIEEHRQFASSALWDLQRKYFEEKGFEAWRQGDVPHYVTSNPRIADAYAAMILAQYADTRNKGTLEQDEPFYIIELGAGSGRFSYYLLKRLHFLCEQAGIDVNSFSYIITDFTQSNLDFWRLHPCLQYFFEKGLCDIAILDATKNNELLLQVSGKTIGSASVSQPLTIVANYFFDTIPQDLFFIDEHKVYPCQLSLACDKDPGQLQTSDILTSLQFDYKKGDSIETFFQEEYLNDLIGAYRKVGSAEYMLFPAIGISCLHFLRTFSSAGTMVLTADKGNCLLEYVLHRSPPAIAMHGSFSLSVNYHAFKIYCERENGIFLFPKQTNEGISTACLLFRNGRFDLPTVKTAFHKYFIESGPSDFYNAYSTMRGNSGSFDMSSILSSLRLSLYDSHQLQLLMPRVFELLPGLDQWQRKNLSEVMEECWSNYYPIGEYADLAEKIGTVLYEIEMYSLAIKYFAISRGLYGNDSGIVYNMAACYYQLNDVGNCMRLLNTLRGTDQSERAIALLESLTTNIVQHEYAR